MPVIVRNARAEDADALFALGRNDKVFEVSSRIPFYERGELEEWIANPRDNLLCVATSDRAVVGFFFCKIMSSHWAMLDNFYVIQAYRGGSAGPAMLRYLIEKLKERNVVYLTTLVDRNRATLARLTRRWGFQFTKSYDWYEMFLT